MMKSFNLRVLAIAGTLSLAAALYAFVPPPQAAKAFEAQSTWGGTGGGTANAQTIAINNVLSLNDVLGVPLRYVPAADNTGPATIAINGLTATAVRRPSNIGLVALSGGELQAGVTMTVMYNGATIEIQGPVDMTPIGKSVEFRQSVTPRGTLIEDGSCVSRTTYAPLFSAIGTNYGACDGTTTFGLPFSNGRSFVALDNQGAATANVVTSAGSGCTATAVGVCGSQNATLTLTQLPTGITSSGAVVNAGGLNLPAVSGSILTVTVNSGSSTVVPASPNTWVNASLSASVTSNNTSGAAHPILNPISLGRRAIKY
jgi:microcystin-dependent protein